MSIKSEPKKKNSLMEYFEDSYQELKKVVWPTKNQAIRLTFLVIAVVIVTAILIGLLDFAFGQGNKLLLDIAPKGSLPATAETAPIDITAEPGMEVGDVTVTTGEEAADAAGEVVPEVVPEEAGSEATDAEAAPEVAPEETTEPVTE